MPLSVDHLPRAHDDLLEIWLYIAEHNEPAADRTLQKIAGVTKMLSEQPKAGRSRPELGVPNLRSYAVGNHILFYVPSAEAITVVRVLEGHRDVQAVFDTDDLRN